MLLVCYYICVCIQRGDRQLVPNVPIDIHSYLKVKVKARDKEDLMQHIVFSNIIIHVSLSTVELVQRCPILSQGERTWSMPHLFRQHCRLPILESKSKSKLQWDEQACLHLLPLYLFPPIQASVPGACYHSSHFVSKLYYWVILLFSSWSKVIVESTMLENDLNKKKNQRFDSFDLKSL